MSYIGNYIGGVGYDTRMPSILDLNDYIQKGFATGRAQGQNQQLAQLAQAAYNDTGADQQQDVSKAIGINPQAGYTLAKLTGSQSAAEQQQAQLKRYGGTASGIFSALRNGDKAGAEGLYQSVIPELAAMAAKSGGTPPPPSLDAALADPKISAVMYQLASQYGSGIPAPDKGVVIAAGGELVNPTTGAKMASVPNRGQIVGGYYFDPNTGTASPIPIKGTQNGVGVDSPVQGAGAGTAPQATPVGQPSVSFQFAPGTPQAVIDATKAAAAAEGDTAPAQTPAGGPSTLAQAMAGNKQVTTLTPEQVKAAGLPDGTVAQRSPDGAIHIVSKPADMGESGMGLLTDDGKALMDAAIAHGYNMPMPSMGYGKAGTAAKADAINSLAERFKAAGKSPDEAVSLMIEGNTATSGLRSLQHINAKIGGWEQSASKQADIALNMSNQVNRSGVPIFNSWLLAGRQATGDVQVAQFNNTVNTLAEEYAKVMSGGSSSAATDSTRALAHHMLNSAMTAQQFAGVVAKMRQEMTARTQALGEAVMSQRGAITSNEGGNMGGWPGEPAPTPQAPQGAAQAPAGWSIQEVHQ